MTAFRSFLYRLARLLGDVERGAPAPSCTAAAVIAAATSSWMTSWPWSRA